MSILRGHEDLKPKAIVGFDMGYALVQCGEGIMRYRLGVGPGGALLAEPAGLEPVNDGVDQISTLPEPDLRARRYADIDQPMYE